MTEVWKDISGYEGLYQVSNLGAVRSKDRRAVNHRNGATRIVRGGKLAPFDNGHGYLCVCLHSKGHRKNYYVHRLVAEAFIDNPLEKPCINHLDSNTRNNNAENLEWCTQLENVRYSVEKMKKPRSKSRPSNTGEKYISRRQDKRNGRIYYRVNIRSRGIDKTFNTIQEAKIFKEGVV